VTERRGKQRISVREAAILLGISENAVTTCIRRGTLRSEKTNDQIYVWLDEVPDADHDAVYPQEHKDDSPRAKAKGIQELREQVHHFRGILAMERHARRRTDTIIVELAQANATLASRVPEPEHIKPESTPSEEAEPDRAEPEIIRPEREEPEKLESHPATEVSQKAPERPFTQKRKPVPGRGSDLVIEDEGRDGDEVSIQGNTEVTKRHASRLERRLRVLERRQHRPEPISVLKLLTTEEIRLALALTERAGVLPNGEVRYPEAFRQATPEEQEALEHWRKLCDEPLDHLELAEELLDRMGEAHGWRSHEAVKAALLLKRLELPEDSSWYVGKMAEAVLNFYAVLQEHPDEGRHPKVRGAVRRLERLEEMDRIDPERRSTPEEDSASEVLEAPHEQRGDPKSVVREPESAKPRSAWWKRMFGA
jgi:hypothetical protein